MPSDHKKLSKNFYCLNYMLLLRIHSAPSVSNLKGLAKFIQYCGHLILPFTIIFEKKRKIFIDKYYVLRHIYHCNDCLERKCKIQMYEMFKRVSLNCSNTIQSIFHYFKTTSYQCFNIATLKNKIFYGCLETTSYESFQTFIWRCF